MLLTFARAFGHLHTLLQEWVQADYNTVVWQGTQAAWGQLMATGTAPQLPAASRQVWTAASRWCRQQLPAMTAATARMLVTRGTQQPCLSAYNLAGPGGAAGARRIGAAAARAAALRRQHLYLCCHRDGRRLDVLYGATAAGVRHRLCESCGGVRARCQACRSVCGPALGLCLQACSSTTAPPVVRTAGCVCLVNSPYVPHSCVPQINVQRNRGLPLFIYRYMRKYRGW